MLYLTLKIKQYYFDFMMSIFTFVYYTIVLFYFNAFRTFWCTYKSLIRRCVFLVGFPLPSFPPLPPSF